MLWFRASKSVHFNMLWSIIWTFSENWSIFGIYFAEKSIFSFYLHQNRRKYLVSLKSLRVWFLNVIIFVCFRVIKDKLRKCFIGIYIGIFRLTNVNVFCRMSVNLADFVQDLPPAPFANTDNFIEFSEYIPTVLYWLHFFIYI